MQDSSTLGSTLKASSSVDVRIQEIDGLRAIACLAVVLAHYRPEPAIDPGSSVSLVVRSLDSLSLANLGVVFFFTLSSFLLTYLGVREWEREHSFSIAHFYLRRCFRIWPLYFSIVAIDMVTTAPWGPFAAGFKSPEAYWTWISTHYWIFIVLLSNWSLALRGFAGHIDLFPPSLGILWSIAVEEQFYVLFPFIVLLTLRKRKTVPFVIASLVLGAILFRALFEMVPIDESVTTHSANLYYATFTYADVLVVGAVAGWLAAREFEGVPAIPRVFQWRGSGWLLFAGLILLGFHWQDMQQVWLLRVVMYGIAGAVFAAVLVWTVLNPHSVTSKILRSRVLSTLGILAFGMYVWHPTIITVVQQSLGSLPVEQQLDVNVKAVAAVLTFLAGTIGAAAISYGLIEHPFLQLRARGFRRGPFAASRASADASRWWMVAAASTAVVLVVQISVHFYFGPGTRA